MKMKVSSSGLCGCTYFRFMAKNYRVRLTQSGAEEAQRDRGDVDEFLETSDFSNLSGIFGDFRGFSGILILHSNDAFYWSSSPIGLEPKPFLPWRDRSLKLQVQVDRNN